VSDTPEENNRKLKELAAQNPKTVDGVIAVLTQIEAVADRLSCEGEKDGIACFTQLYHRITVDVLEAYKAGSLFHCGAFILELDLAFAQRYLDALATHTDGGSPAPACWRILFDRRSQDRARWRFAAGGVNAHVNFDLAFALLDVWEDHPDSPLSTSEEQYADYQAINTIFHRRMDELCERNDAPWTLLGDDGSFFDRAGNVLGDLLVVGTRDLAWTFAERMWRHRGEVGYRDVPTATLDVVAAGLADVVL
jgi:hypothetical protein